MTRNRLSYAAVAGACAAGLLAAGCATPSSETASAMPDPRQGEEVRNICFQSQIRGWQRLDNRSVIVEVGVRDEYKLELVGTCQPDDAFINIGLISRGGGSCLNPGDRLITDARYGDGSCSISRIYKWNKDAGKTPATDTPPAG